MTGAVQVRIGFLGAGRMAVALARGWLNAGLLRPEDCRASDPSEPARLAFVETTGCLAVADNATVADDSDLVVLAVKPQSMPGLMAEVGPLLKGRLVVSIAAGVTLRQLADGL